MPVETVLCPDSKDLMVLETPLLRVSRPVAACSRCRSAKVKCDGKLPACTACERAGKASECSSTNDQFAKGKERSYVATLESRVEKLERKLAEARARRKSSVTMPDAESTAPSRRPSANLLSGKPVDKRAARRREAHDIDDLVSDFGLLAVNATARDFYGFTSEMSYARLILSACSKEPLPTGMTKVLPPRYAATPLIQHYLNTAFAILPFFEESSFYASVDAVYSSDPSKASPFDHWCVRMVLAIATLALSEQRGDTHYCDAVGHLNAALEHSEAVLHPGFISGIQATLLLVEYALLDPHHFDSWSLIGAASRAMVDLGMHQDPSRSSSITKSKLELRRRVYWCVYALDRSTSLVQTRAFSFSDDSANVGIPFSSKSTSVSKGEPKGSQAWLQSFDSAVDLFHLRQLQSEWYTTLFQTGRTPWQDPYPYIWRTYENMTAWSDKASPRTSKGIRTMFELELLYSYVYILSPSPRCPVISKYAQRLIFEHCISYASKMFKLTTEARGQQSPVTFYDAMRAYMTGRQFVDVVARNQDTLLSGLPPTPPATSPAAVSVTDPMDPMAPASTVLPPPLPSSASGAGDPTVRAITAINNFTTILSRFGIRFGYINWRDRFQQESAALLAQLHHRKQATISSPEYALWNPPTNVSPMQGPISQAPVTGTYDQFANPAMEQGFAGRNTGFGQQMNQGLQGGWVGSAAQGQQFPFSMSMPPPNPVINGRSEMGYVTAWETLPGGSLNARFS